jgi:hypothetical protein
MTLIGIRKMWLPAVAGVLLSLGCAPSGPSASAPEKPAAKPAEVGKPAVKDHQAVTEATATKKEEAPAKVEKPEKPEKPSAPAETAGGTIVLEAESFDLEKADVKELAGASGGKAVFFQHADGQASTSVKLAKGRYEVVVRMQAPDPESDAFYLTLAGTEERLYPEDHKKLCTTGKMTVSVSRDGPCALKIEPAESGFYIDRVEIRRAD